MNELFLLFIIFPGLLYFVIGFFYHYCRNKTYWNVIVESVIIGSILGYFMQAEGIGLAEWILTNILIVFTGGVLALKIRRSSSSKLSEDDKQNYEPDIGKINNRVYEKPEKNKNIEDKFSKYPLMKSDRFKTFNEVLPFTPPEEIRLYPYNIKNSFKSFKRISVYSDKSLHSKTTAMGDVNNKLKEKASSLGANAVIRVVYKQGIFTLFRGIRGIGQAVYIEDLENVEKTYPAGTNFLLIMGIYWILIGLLRFADYNQFMIPLGLVMVIYGVFTRRGYINKTFFLTFLGIIIVNGLMLGRYILKNDIQLFNFEFYFGAGFLAMLLISFVYSYKHRKNDPNLLWRDDWGFK